jgi:hypothetical protein
MAKLGPVVMKILMSSKLTDDLKVNPQEIRDRFRDHFVPQINRTFEPYKFNQRRKLEESFIADMVVIGVQTDSSRKKLLQETV